MRARPLATAAVLALTTALLAAAAAPACPSAATVASDGRAAATRLAGNTEVPVRGGSARFDAPPTLLAALRARGVAVAEIDAQGQLSPHYSTGGMSLGIRSGAVTNSGGKVGGELRFTRAGIALINIKTKKVARVTGFVGNLSQGTLSAVVNRGARITLGSFTRPRINPSIDTEAAALRMNTGITVTAAAAARLNAALGTTCFRGGGPLLRVRIDASLDPSVDLPTALNLGHGARRAGQEDQEAHGSWG
ncbi:hypothetical protein [Streptomyces sp. NRRL S-1813]|uniref:hypothetical protein n=1 Tax=Streptomyces sp. NRRL S-1813 TaxID=1463888 RepID=UPI00068982AD|nr:hypothetical protein [Streptomyces sp. NRRL S-1813]